MSYSIDERFNQIDEAIEELATGGTPDVLTLYLTKQEASNTYLTQSDASNDYLPLSAGSSKPLSGALYGSNIDSLNPIQVGMFAKDNGAFLEGYYNGVLDGGISTVANDKRVIVYGNGNSVVFRPNGRGDANGQVYINSSGQIIGGLTPKIQRSASDVSRAAGWTSLFTHTSIPKGNWMLYFQYTFNCSATTYCLICITRGVSDTYDPIIARQYIDAIGSNTATGANCVGFIQESDFDASHVESMDFIFRVWLSGAVTQKGYSCGCIRLG